MSAVQETEPEGGYDDPPMTIWDHLRELRKRVVIILVVLVVFSGISWEFRELLLRFMTEPFVNAWREQGISGKPMLHFQTPAAAFFAYFKLSLLGGVAMAAPVIFYQVWAFIAPGLYAKEKKFIIPFAVSSSALFVGGGYYGWRFAFPLAFQYLLGLSGNIEEGGLDVTPTVMMGEYIDFVTRMLLGFGLIFEIPLFIFFLSVAGVVNYLQLIRYGRWFVVGAFVVAAIITPPDVVSQIMMALPMLILYAGSIGLAYLFGKPPTEAQREAYKQNREENKKAREAERLRLRAEKEALRKAKKAAKAAKG